MSLRAWLPREHGLWAWVGLPLIAALALTPRALPAALAVLAAFLVANRLRGRLPRTAWIEVPGIVLFAIAGGFVLVERVERQTLTEVAGAQDRRSRTERVGRVRERRQPAGAVEEAADALVTREHRVSGVLERAGEEEGWIHRGFRFKGLPATVS